MPNLKADPIQKKECACFCHNSWGDFYFEKTECEHCKPVNAPKPPTEEWDKRMELALRRLSAVVDLDVDPPVRYGAVKCSTALSELEDLDKLHKDLLATQKTQVINEIIGRIDIELHKSHHINSANGNSYSIGEEEWDYLKAKLLQNKED